MATLTAETKSGGAVGAYKLLIGEGYYLAIEGTYDLLIQEAGPSISWTPVSSNSATFTSETKN